MNKIKQCESSICKNAIAANSGESRTQQKRSSRSSRKYADTFASLPLGEVVSDGGGEPSSKKTRLVALLVCDGGATIAQMIEATGWLTGTRDRQRIFSI
jgi:hypothetical protein